MRRYTDYVDTYYLLLVNYSTDCKHAFLLCFSSYFFVNVNASERDYLLLIVYSFYRKYIHLAPDGYILTPVFFPTCVSFLRRKRFGGDSSIFSISINVYINTNTVCLHLPPSIRLPALMFLNK